MPATPPGTVVQARIVLHGASRLELPGRPHFALDRKQAAVLTWLAVRGPTPRGRLANLLWPEVNEDRARGNLRQRLFRLRQGAGAVVSEDEGVLRLSAGVELEAAALGAQWLDGHSYDDCEEFGTWLESERESQRAVRRLSCLATVREHAQRGELDLALQQADALLAADRESEEVYRALMEVYYLRGDRAAAIAVWDRCKDMSRTLYGVLPTAETQRLGALILDATASAPIGAPAFAIPVTLLRPPQLIGRAGVIDTLVAAWRVGDASCVSGEAGVGKSRVLAEFAAAIGPCVAAACRPGDSAVSFASLSRLVLAGIERFGADIDSEARRWVARLLPKTAAASEQVSPEPLRTEHERDQATHALAKMLGSFIARGCTAFIFDDLQFADAESVHALQRLTELEGLPPGGLPARLVLGTRREESTPHADALLGSLASSRRLQRVDLAPLNEAEVIGLMRSLELANFAVDALAPRLHRQVGGNPAFLLESVKLITSLGRLPDAAQELPIPPGIEAVVERRLALLSAPARHVAELAAVAGQSFSVELAARALACSLAELAASMRELEGRQVLAGKAFVHDLVARAVRRSVPSAMAEFLHRFMAVQLTAAHAEPAIIAEHWHACAEWAAAAKSYHAAAEQARHAVRAAELARLLDAAAECFERCGAHDASFAVRFERLEVTAAPDYNATCAQQLQHLERIAATEPQRLQVTAAAVAQHAAHARYDTIAEGELGMKRALELGLHAIAFEFVPALAWQYSNRGDGDSASTVLEQMHDWVQREGGPRRGARLLNARAGMHALAGRLSAAIADSEAVLAQHRSAQEPIEMLPLLANIGLFRAWRGEFELARLVLTEAQLIREQLHGRGTATLIDLHLGGVLRDLGAYKSALALLEPALNEFRGQLPSNADMLTDTVVAENHLAQLWISLGQPDRALACMQTDPTATDSRFRLRSAMLRLRIARVTEQPAGALLAEVQRLAGEVTSPFHRVLALLEVARHLGPRESMELLRVLCADALMPERPGLELHALTLMLDATLRMGDGAAALTAWRRVVELDARCLPFDLDPIELWSVAHLARLRQVVPDDTPQIRAKAMAWLRDIDASHREAFLRRHAVSLSAFESQLS